MRADCLVIICLSLTCSGLSLLSAPFTWAQTADAFKASVVSAAESSSEARAGVRFAAAQKIGAGQLELVFDPERMELLALEAGDNLSSALLENSLIQPGRLKVAFVTTDPVVGAGELLRLRFGLRGEWTQTSLAIENFRAWNDDTVEVPVIVESGKISRPIPALIDQTPGPAVVSPNTPPVTPQVVIQYLIPGWVYALGGAGATTILFLLILLLRQKA
jgi:hypothetical protein